AWGPGVRSSASRDLTLQRSRNLSCAGSPSQSWDELNPKSKIQNRKCPALRLCDEVARLASRCDCAALPLSKGESEGVAVSVRMLRTPDSAGPVCPLISVVLRLCDLARACAHRDRRSSRMGRARGGGAERAALKCQPSRNCGAADPETRPTTNAVTP